VSHDFVASSGLPWRGPGPGRPGLALPPDRLALRRAGAWRKRWRYVAAFGEEMLACAARVEVGPLGQTFWALWDRAGQRMWERTRLRPPGRSGEVWTEDPDGGGIVEHAADRGSLVRIEARHRGAKSVQALLRFGAGEWVEAVCPAGKGGYVWTRKRADVAVEADVMVGGDRRRFEARGVEDESAGYHPRHTVWSWSAGVGRTVDGRSVGWNLVNGINDPPERSERAIWVDGEPFEPGACEFRSLEGISFADGSQLAFTAECERRKAENLLVVRYSYRQPFGTFTGALPGGLELERGLGVMEHHNATW
jgi:hypothetical protein